MSERVRDLLARISALEGELRTALHEQEQGITYRIHDKRVEFEASVRAAHKRLQTSLIYWVFKDRPLNLLTWPVIYAMIVPLLLLDLCVTAYQTLCFPVYRVARVRRGDYFVYDRRHLAYLNFIERFHCTYCSYANGLLAYATEVVARTEQYFCPIKHANRVLGLHDRHARFLAYGDAADYAQRLEVFRQALQESPKDEQTASK